MSNVTYTTKQGDTWSGIAYKAYGDVTLMVDIIKANPTVPIYPVLPANILLNVPVKDVGEVEVLNLPPWKV